MDLLEKIKSELPGATKNQLNNALISMGKTEDEVTENNSYIFEAITHIKNQGGLTTSSKSNLVTTAQVQSQITKLEGKPKSKSNQIQLSNLRIQLQELDVRSVNSDDSNNSKAINQIDKGLNSFIQTLNSSSIEADNQLGQSIQDYANGASEVAYNALEAHNEKVRSINAFAERANQNLNMINENLVNKINDDINFRTQETGEEMIDRLGIDLSWMDLVKS